MLLEKLLCQINRKNGGRRGGRDGRTGDSNYLLNTEQFIFTDTLYLILTKSLAG